MSYKTFEDMKHKIPEGATHYADECASYYFTWFKYVSGKPMLFARDGYWVSSMFDRETKPIPPEEPTTEWSGEGLPPVGVECEVCNCGSNWQSAKVLFMGAGLCVVDHGYGDQHYHLNSVKFRKPETPEQREERERLENGRALFELVQCILIDMGASREAHPYDEPFVDDSTRELYERLASKLNYRKAK